ncbi:hypothetical protein M378DRAFT_286220 [Amanita muscaria Koide BX008]|uniref:Uncharacterized protein n=1 Tax=Amanita muscaria (strain Koide BX008) TaxID=946122 RepID=A0A0C2S896_AMAMK|nr:hypothetical protein M378DRAFT_286220 [Amanita muscaria Koide BX008]
MSYAFLARDVVQRESKFHIVLSSTAGIPVPRRNTRMTVVARHRRTVSSDLRVSRGDYDETLLNLPVLFNRHAWSIRIGVIHGLQAKLDSLKDSSTDRCGRVGFWAYPCIPSRESFSCSNGHKDRFLSRAESRYKTTHTLVCHRWAK